MSLQRSLEIFLDWFYKDVAPTALESSHANEQIPIYSGWSDSQPQRSCSLQPSVGRHSRPTLGNATKLKTTLKELWRCAGKTDATHSGLMNWLDDFPG